MPGLAWIGRMVSPTNGWIHTGAAVRTVLYSKKTVFNYDSLKHWKILTVTLIAPNSGEQKFQK